ncbi:MAG: phosphoribosyltransferase family protein [Plesiomonas sp.]
MRLPAFMLPTWTLPTWARPIQLNAPCLLCQQPLFRAADALCYRCQHNLPHTHWPCPQCGLQRSTANSPCYRCRHHSPPWQTLVAVSDYCAPLDRLLHRFKYRGQFWLATPLARLLLLALLAHRRAQATPWPDLLLPVPLHRQRHWRRGFNQTALLARPLSHWLQIPLDSDVLIRYKESQAQHTLGHTERQTNAQHSYAVTRPLTGLRVALLDDVVTTGATVRALSQMLLAQGASEVHIWCLCRTQ